MHDETYKRNVPLMPAIKPDVCANWRKGQKTEGTNAHLLHIFRGEKVMRAIELIFATGEETKTRSRTTFYSNLEGIHSLIIQQAFRRRRNIAHSSGFHEKKRSSQTLGAQKKIGF